MIVYPILPLSALLQSFLRKSSYKVTQSNLSNFNFHYHDSQGEVHDFSEEVQKNLRGKRSQGRCASPPTFPQNLAM